MKCPECGKDFKTEIGLKTHMGMMHSESGDRTGTKEQTPRTTKAVGSGRDAVEPRSPAIAVNPYPPLAQWQASEEKAKVAAAPPGLPTAGGPAIFDSTALWKGAAAIVNELLPDKAPLKVEMSDAAAIALDASLKQMGFVVETRAQQTVVPWWAPFAITFTGVFGVPIIAALIPLLKETLEKATASRKERVKLIPRPPTAPMIPVPGTSPEEGPRPVMAPVNPEAIPPQPYRDPGAQA